MGRTSIAYWLLLSACIGCSGESGSGDPASVAGGGTAATPGTGGTFSGLGGVGNGGTANAVGGKATTGGTTASMNGGSPSAGGNTSNGGSTGTGGNASGATAARGGSANGGSSTGGVATGGKASSGGSSTGGVTAGGKASSGGSSTGGMGTGGTTATGGDPPTGTMRVFYLRPSDVPLDQRYPDGIGQVMVEAQSFFQQQLGKTFKLNSPIVEVVVGEHERSWYENTANGGDKYWWAATNAQQEIARRFHLTIPDPRWMVVSEVSAEGTGAGGGATGGWVLLPGHDADGGASYPSNKARWVGGMVHELGHAFGLPDSTSTDGTCMSASFYGWPNCTFTQSMKDKMLNGRWGVGKFLF